MHTYNKFVKNVKDFTGLHLFLISRSAHTRFF